MKYKPEYLFLWFAIPFGLAMVFLIPPLGGSDEGFQYQRLASIAYGQLLNMPVAVPSGIVAFIKAGGSFFYEGLQPPFSFTLQEWHKMAAIQNSVDSSLMQPNYMTVHDPFSYLPQIPVFRLAAMLGIPPLFILYMVRLVSLAAGTVLVFMAIRRIPSHKYSLCAMALLPTIVLYRSFLNADALTNGLAFLFIASVLYEMAQEGIMPLKNLFILAVMAFVLAQCKNIYALLLFIVLAIPGSRFSGKSSHVFSILLILLPGIMASLAWMIILRHTSFQGTGYHTWGGDANPDSQVAYMMAHPFEYIKTFFRTFLMTPLIPMAFMGIAGDVGPGHFLTPISVIVLLYFFLAVIISDRNYNVYYGACIRILAAGICLSAMIIIPALLYIHWTEVGAPEIKGFQGRYLYPLLPLALLFVRPSDKKRMTFTPGFYVFLQALLGLSLSLWTIWKNYY